MTGVAKPLRTGCIDRSAARLRNAWLRLSASRREAMALTSEGEDGWSNGAFSSLGIGIKETVVLRFLCGHSTQLQLAYVSELNSERRFIIFSDEHYIYYHCPTLKDHHGVSLEACPCAADVLCSCSAQNLYPGLTDSSIGQDRNLDSPQPFCLLSSCTGTRFASSKSVPYYREDCGLPRQRQKGNSSRRAPLVQYSGPVALTVS